MSHRSRLFQERNKLSSVVPTFANKQPAPPKPQQVGINDLIPMLISQGVPVQYKIETCDDPPVIRFTAVVGPLQIPLDFNPEQARAMIASFTAAVDKVDPPAQMLFGPGGIPIPYCPQVPCLSMDEALAEAEKTMQETELGYTLAAEACTDAPE